MILTIIASTSIETVQMCIGRVFDVDDIILNLLGGILGYLLYIIIKKVGNILPNIFKSEWFLNIISIIILISIIVIII